MSLIKKKEKKTVFGIIVGNRDVFPDHLAKKGREDILTILDGLGYDYIILGENDTKFGVVETYEDAKKCAHLFKENADKIIGILICLPNFGDEKGVVNSIKLSGLNVPILIQASSDEIDKMNRANRRDAFCGKISVCSVLYQYDLPFTLTKNHICAIKSEEFKQEIQRFEKICRVVHLLKK